MIVDASVVIDAVSDREARGVAARNVLSAQPEDEPLIAPGHFAVEVMSGLRSLASRHGHPFTIDAVGEALLEAESYGIFIEATPWADVHRAWTLSQASLRHVDAVYVAAAERHGTALLTTDSRIERSGAPIRCKIITVKPADGSASEQPDPQRQDGRGAQL